MKSLVLLLFLAAIAGVAVAEYYESDAVDFDSAEIDDG